MIPADGYRFFEDPGHGWLEVPLATCEGLAVSPYSYWGYAVGGKWDGTLCAYLEEDVDAAVWAGANGKPFPCYLHSEPVRDSHVRSLERFPASASDGFRLAEVVA